MPEQPKENSRGKRPNAFKHGIFSNMTILPGEDEQEFSQLGAALFLEWTPDGPTETDAVFTILKCMWRKRRIQKFIKAKMDARSIDPHHRAFDPDLMAVCLRLILNSDPKFLERLLDENPQAKEFLATDKPQHLRDLVSAAEISKKIVAGLEARRPLPPLPEPSPEIKLMMFADILNEELFKHELALEERLDADIDRAVKRLVQAKAVKQMLASPSLNGHAQQKRISASNGA